MDTSHFHRPTKEPMVYLSLPVASVGSELASAQRVHLVDCLHHFSSHEELNQDTERVVMVVVFFPTYWDGPMFFWVIYDIYGYILLAI